MAIISFIEAEEVAKKILKHLGLWEPKPRPPPRVVKSKPMNSRPRIDYAESQVVPSDNTLKSSLEKSGSRTQLVIRIIQVVGISSLHH